jgi:hypothetical protein
VILGLHSCTRLPMPTANWMREAAGEVDDEEEAPGLRSGTTARRAPKANFAHIKEKERNEFSRMDPLLPDEKR